MWVPMNFHGTKKLFQMVSHDLWALKWKIAIHGIWNPRAWNGLLSPVTLILTPFCFITFPFRQGFSYMQVGIWVSWECPVSKKMIFLTSQFKKVLLTWKLRWTLGRQIVAVAKLTSKYRLLLKEELSHIVNWASLQYSTVLIFYKIMDTFVHIVYSSLEFLICLYYT